MATREVAPELQQYNRLGEINYNTKNELMQIIAYRKSGDIDVQFLDENKGIVNTSYAAFKKGKIKNPLGYHMVYQIGRMQNNTIRDHKKEAQCYADMCFRMTPDFQMANPTYQGAEMCQLWKDDFKNFFTWITHESNYSRWKEGYKWCLDKDILIKNNKIYSPETCCLVPTNVNTLFVKKNKNRGKYPIGVTPNHQRYMALMSNPLVNNTRYYLGTYDTPEEAFEVYKKAKEELIKDIAQIEYNQGNITDRCYRAMLDYKVEVTD